MTDTVLIECHPYTKSHMGLCGDSLQRLQAAETRNQELSQSVTSATRPLLRQIENLQATLGGQTASWEKLEKSISDRLGKTISFRSFVYVDITPYLLIEAH